MRAWLIYRIGTESRYTEIKDEIIIGRDSSCHIVIQDPKASKQHTKISLKGSRCIVEDLGSTNGTRVNGHKIKNRVSVMHRDKIRVAGINFVVHIGEEPKPAEVKSAGSGFVGTISRLIVFVVFFGAAFIATRFFLLAVFKPGQ